MAFTIASSSLVSIEVVSASIPPVSDARDAPVVIVFFTMALVMILVSTFISCIVLRCNLHDSGTQSKMGPLLRILFLQILPSFLRMKPPGAEKVPSPFKLSTWTSNPNVSKLDEISDESGSHFHWNFRDFFGTLQDLSGILLRLLRDPSGIFPGSLRGTPPEFQ